MDTHWSYGLALILVAGVAFDVFFAKGMRGRGWLQAGIVVLAVVVVGAMPRCATGSGQDGPDIEAPPYPY